MVNKRISKKMELVNLLRLLEVSKKAHGSKISLVDRLAEFMMKIVVIFSLAEWKKAKEQVKEDYMMPREMKFMKVTSKITSVRAKVKSIKETAKFSKAISEITIEKVQLKTSEKSVKN
jgi:hypothetical protein